MTQASEKQLNYLKDLGYRGQKPATIEEASILIAAIKEYDIPAKEGEQFLFHERKTGDARARLYLISEADYEFAGWRIKLKASDSLTPVNEKYDGAFLPKRVAYKHIRFVKDLNLENQTQLQGRPAKGKEILGPLKLAEIGSGQPRQPRQKTATPKALVSQPTSKPKKNRGCLFKGCLLIVILHIAIGLIAVFSGC